MTEAHFKLSFMALVAAKLHAPDPDFIKAKQEVYWTMLREIPDDLWEKGVAYCLRHGEFFPSIETLAEASIGAKWKYSKTPHPEKVPWEETLLRELKQRRDTKLLEEQMKQK